MLNAPPKFWFISYSIESSGPHFFKCLEVASEPLSIRWSDQFLTDFSWIKIELEFLHCWLEGTWTKSTLSELQHWLRMNFAFALNRSYTNHDMKPWYETYWYQHVTSLVWDQSTSHQIRSWRCSCIVVGNSRVFIIESKQSTLNFHRIVVIG